MDTVIYSPIRLVFDFVSTPENDFQWQYGTLVSSSLSDDSNSIGSFFRSIGHAMGQRAQGTFEVTEYEQNKRYGFKSLSGDLHFQTSYTFEIVNNSTKVNVSTQANLGKSSQVDERILEKRMRKQLKENMKLLKDLLEEKTAVIVHPQ
jgi:carbon monoxide dehydrogenase subunit G